jgi:hypothetical protein
MTLERVGKVDELGSWWWKRRVLLSRVSGKGVEVDEEMGGGRS